jgi:hypothetical protein
MVAGTVTLPDASRAPDSHRMNERIVAILDQIHLLESELEKQFAKRRMELAYTVRDRVARFEIPVLRRHRQLRVSLARYVLGARPVLILTAPVIYSLVIPFALLDLFVWLYQFVCFPVYGIPRVRRRDFVVMDRAQLAYLNAIEKLNCAYCSYANGLVAYVREVASLTEQYWCPIKHAQRVSGTHQRYSRFFDYGDAESYRGELGALREELRKQDP